jgi:hypothetical protein
MKKTLLTISAPLALLGCWAPAALWAQAPAPTPVPVCEQDTAVQERFLPVELLTGNPMPDAQAAPALVFAPVERTYPFVDVTNGAASMMETQLKGPMQWVGEGGKAYEVYERKVPRAHERFALTPDQTAIGRVYDDRFGNATNEGKFPVGLWKQGQKRVYDTVYYSPRGARSLQSSVEIEKLSCTYEGVAGAVQYRWKTSQGLDYGYVYAPGRGLVQVVTYSRGR